MKPTEYILNGLAVVGFLIAAGVAIMLSGGKSITKKATPTQSPAPVAQPAPAPTPQPAPAPAPVTVPVVYVPPPPPSTLAATGKGLLVPLYIYPSAGAFDPLVAAKIRNPGVPIVAVINPNSGPGASLSTDYQGGINYLRSNGIKVLGYVHTSYGARSLGTVEADIAAYASFYTLDGIFFDEVGAGFASYYQAAVSYAHSKGLSFTVGNPGAQVQGYAGLFDVLVIYEGAGIPPLQAGPAPILQYAYIAYGVPAITASAVDASENAVGWVYVTDATLPNPYDVFPSYLAQLVSLI